MKTQTYQSAKIDIINSMAKILVIDDDVHTTWLIDSVFSKEGYQVFSVNISANALSEALQVKPDIILLDLMMPDVDGIETCKILLANNELKDTPILVFSAVGEVERKVEAFNAGARDFITKPVHIDELKSRIRAWTNHREGLWKP